VAIALVASWFVAVIFTPYIGVKLLPNIAVSHNHDPHAVYETALYRILRSMIQWCVDHRVKVVLATVGVFALSISAFGHVQQQFFPLSERPELFLQLRLPEGTAVQRHGKIREKGGSAVEGRQGYFDLHRLCRPGLAALLARAEPAAAERGFRRDRDRRQGCRGARTDQVAY
jgi:multidrug efflux pump subunit AcrB